MYNKNPLYALGEFDWRDYSIFKTHLRLPRPLLRIVFKNYTDLHQAVLDLPKILTAYDNHLWEKIKMDASKNERIYRTVGIPPMYFKKGMFITEKPKDQALVAKLIDNADKVVEKGLTILFHSSQNSASMMAATAFMRSIIDTRNTLEVVSKCYCVSYVSALEEVKQWDYSNPQVHKLHHVPMLLLWGVGMEYTTDFTCATLKSMLQQRKAEGLTTLIVSGLTEADFNKRYGEYVDISVGFTDTKIKQTLADLLSDLEASNG